MKMLKLIKTEKGFSLIEVLIAVGLVGLMAAAFLMAIATASKAVLLADERTTAESLAKSQIESIKEQEYDDAGLYLPIDTSGIEEYENYEIVYPIDFMPLEDGLQKITVTIMHQDKVVFTLEGYKVE
jgi:prepilin-type N-terminal cleavage/methylation domain-containing protein